MKEKEATFNCEQCPYGKGIIELFGLGAVVRDKAHYVNRSLRVTGRSLNATHIIMVEAEKEHTGQRRYYQWRPSDKPSRDDMPWITDPKCFEYWSERLRKTPFIRISETNRSDRENLRRYYPASGTGRLMMMSLTVFGKFTGIICVESDHSSKWDETEINFIRTVSRIIGTFLENREMERTLKVNQQQLFQAQKLDSLGTLVAGMAHEINNPMNLIQYNIDLFSHIWRDMLKVVDEKPEDYSGQKFGGLSYAYILKNSRRLLDDMRSAAMRVIDIVAELKRFARKEDVFKTMPVLLNDAVNGARKLCKAAIEKHDVSVLLDLDEKLPLIDGNRQSLEQIVVNLVINAAESMDDHPGTIHIRTGYDKNSEEIYLEVADTGKGVDPSISDKIFDPFVTSKLSKGGTGLGLSVTYSLVKAHNGRISHMPNPEAGTTFAVHLPVPTSEKKPADTTGIIDTLTGCYSHAYLYGQLPQEIKRAGRYQHPLSLILCGMRRKSLHDEMDSRGGDLPGLRNAARQIRMLIRDDLDWVARTDSARIAVVLPETDLSGAEHLGRRLFNALSKQSDETSPSDLSVDFGFGVAGLDHAAIKGSVTAREIIEKAEACLSRALELSKNRPQNRVVAIQIGNN